MAKYSCSVTIRTQSGKSELDLAQDLHADVDVVVQENDVRALGLEKLAEGAHHRHRVLRA